CATVGTKAVIDATRCCETRFCGGGRSPPVVDRLLVNHHVTVLISATEAPSAVIGITGVWPKNRYRESGVENSRGCDLPSSQNRIEKSVRVSTVSPAATEGKFVNANKIQAVAHIHRRGTVVSVEIVAVLD